MNISRQLDSFIIHLDSFNYSHSMNSIVMSR
ncbi:unnamed protein product, partial [marine sediment metagenome]